MKDKGILLKPEPNYQKRYDESDENMKQNILKRCPYAVGQRLYLKETWAEHLGKKYYRIDTLATANYTKINGTLFKGWKSSQCMPKKFARKWFVVTDVRVERVQDIDAVEAEAEGIRRPRRLCPDRHDEYILDRFQRLWDSIYGPGAWERNDWCWCVSFQKIEKPL